LSTAQITQFRTYIKNGYRYKFYADDLPSSVIIRDPETGKFITDYDKGIPIGRYDKETKQVAIYNHLDIRVKTHLVQGTTDEYRVVGFEVFPKSIRNGARLFRNRLDE
jgi:hypothetical protein